MFTNFLRSLLDLLLPAGPDAAFLENASGAELLEKIAPAEEIADGRFRAIFRYRDPLARKAIWEIKYRGNRRILGNFAALLHDILVEEMADEAAFSNFRRPLLVPVPAGKKSLHKRGFNQCERLAKAVRASDKTGIFGLEAAALCKIRETPNQSGFASRSKRLRNLSGAFAADPSAVAGRNVIVLDDVLTTGATMREAARALKAAGARKVIGFALAH